MFFVSENIFRRIINHFFLHTKNNPTVIKSIPKPSFDWSFPISLISSTTVTHTTFPSNKKNKKMLYRISLSESFVSKYAPQIYQYQQRASQHQQQQQEQRSSQQQSNRIEVEDEQTTTAAIEQQQQTTPILSNETLTPIEQQEQQQQQQKRFIPHEQLIDQLAASIGQSLQEKCTFLFFATFWLGGQIFFPFSRSIIEMIYKCFVWNFCM